MTTQERVLMETRRIREPAAATPFSVHLRLNRILSPTDLLGHENLQFQPLSAPAQTPLSAVVRFARVTTPSSLSLPLWTPDPPLQKTRASEPRCRQLLQDTPVCHQHQRPFDLCILLCIRSIFYSQGSCFRLTCQAPCSSLSSEIGSSALSYPLVYE